MAGEENQRILGSAIRALRKQRGLSQEKLAELADVHRNFVGLIERGERNVGIQAIVRLAFALDVSPAQVFERCEFVDDRSSTKPN